MDLKSMSNRREGVNTDIGSRSPILEISVTILGALPWNSNGCSTVCDTRRERVDMTGLMTTRETFLVIRTINKDMFPMFALQFGDIPLNCLHTSSWLPGFDSRNVGMTSSTIPITFKRLRVKRNLDTEFLCNSFKEITCH